MNSVTHDNTQAVAPGSIVSIFGSQLAASAATADTVPLSMSIAGVSVTFNGYPAAIRLVSPTLISVQVPWETLGTDPATGAPLTSGTASVVVTQNGATSNTNTVAVNQFSPGIYAIDNLASSNLALAMNSDGSLVQAVGVVPGLTSHPAQPGDTLMLLATGLGPVDQPIVDGANSADMVRNALTQPQVMIAGVGATVLSATLSPNFVGVYQVQLTVPDGVGTSDMTPVQLQIADLSSPVTTTISVATPMPPPPPPMAAPR
ncbi:MAG TPA: hypothetical protein VGL53_08870 [Bryobacteraceae bacterium]